MHWLLILSFLLSQERSAIHDIHLSQGEIHYNTSRKSLEVSLHIFRDDLELAIEAAGHQNPKLTSVQEHENADSLIALYLEESFQILIDNKKVKFSFLGREDSADLLAVWCYLEGENIEDVKELKLVNHILLNLYDDQKNIVAFTGPAKKRVILFDDGKREEVIQIDNP